MRITNSLLFNTSIRNYRNATERMYSVNQQIDTKLKIQNSYENTSVYIDAMRLNNEIETLQQSSDSSSKAKTFADNTDTALTSFSENLDQFKSKLNQASTSSNSPTSLQALANDMQGIRDYLVNLANTSIIVQMFIFHPCLTKRALFPISFLRFITSQMDIAGRKQSHHFIQNILQKSKGTIFSRTVDHS